MAVGKSSEQISAAVRIDAAAQQSVGQLSGQRHSDARDGGKGRWKMKTVATARVTSARRGD